MIVSYYKYGAIKENYKIYKTMMQLKVWKKDLKSTRKQAIRNFLQI